MFPAFLITFRESLEAAVVVGILLAALRVLQEEKKNIFIWSGVFAGIIMSILFAWVFETFFYGFEGKAEQLYEGFLMIFASILITHMVFWMRKYGKTLRKTFSEKMERILEREEVWALSAIAFFSVLREGVETVIFFQAIDVQADAGISFAGAVLGILVALSLAIMIFLGVKNVSPKKFLSASSVILLFIAAGLFGHSAMEFQEAGYLPVFIDPLFNLSSTFSEKEGVGAFLKALFGYDANPTLLGVVAYIIFLGGVALAWRKKSSS